MTSVVIFLAANRNSSFLQRQLGFRAVTACFESCYQQLELALKSLSKDPFVSFLKVCILSIRLDFLEFELDGGSAVDQPCNRESLEIFGGNVVLNLGMGKLCGRNTGQHLYIPIRYTQWDPYLWWDPSSGLVKTNPVHEGSNFQMPF